MRTRDQSIAEYTWLTVGGFATAISASHDHVRRLIAEGSITGVMDISRRGARVPEYRIPPAELERYKKDAVERARKRSVA